MKKITKSLFILSISTFCVNISGQVCENDIFSDSTKLAEYVYINMHYPLIDFVNNVEGTAVYKYEIDSILKTNNLEIIHSSGSKTLDMEGKRLLSTIPIKEKRYPKHEITISFKLEDNKIYDDVDEMPEFEGGYEEAIKFISKNLNFPLEYGETTVTGRIYCGFIIEKDGSIGSIEILNPLDKYVDAEAIRAIKRMSKWKVGKMNGKPVRVYYIFPIRILMT